MPDTFVYDPLRRRRVAMTPEERVRQWFISVLRDELGVPESKMMSEVSMRTGEITSVIGGLRRKVYRADIVVYDRSSFPVMLVECKRPDVQLTADVAAQAIRYCGIMGVRYMVVTNGLNTYVAEGGDGSLRFLSSVPAYEEMNKR